MDFQNIKQNLEKRGFTVTCFDTGAQAADCLANRIDNTTVGFGGSMTLDEMELYESKKNQKKQKKHLTFAAG